jgi:hypothetical protein
MSDLLEHDPESFSHYVPEADYSMRVQTSPTSAPDFSEVALRIVPIDRPDHAALQAQALDRFWPAFFDAAEARSVNIDPAP